MAFNPMESVKAHPYLWGGGAVVLILVVVVIVASGGEPQTQPVMAGYPGVDPSTVAANSQITQAQLAAGVANSNTTAQASVAAADIAAKLKAAELEATNNASQIQINGQVAMAKVAADADTTKFVSSLSAQVSQAQITAASALTQMTNATATQIAGINAEVGKAQYEYGYKAAVETASITAGRDITIAGYNRDIAMTDIATSHATALMNRDYDYRTNITNQEYGYQNNIVNQNFDVAKMNLQGVLDNTQASYLAWQAGNGVSVNWTSSSGAHIVAGPGTNVPVQ
jgi:hypothetical protein